jgi:acyl-ACP thioesterase
MKSRFKAALLHYHPDKQYLEEDGLKWIVMSEEITVLLNHHFERMRYVVKMLIIFANFLRG